MNGCRPPHRKASTADPATPGTSLDETKSRITAKANCSPLGYAGTSTHHARCGRRQAPLYHYQTKDLLCARTEPDRRPRRWRSFPVCWAPPRPRTATTEAPARAGRSTEATVAALNLGNLELAASASILVRTGSHYSRSTARRIGVHPAAADLVVRLVESLVYVAGRPSDQNRPCRSPMPACYWVSSTPRHQRYASTGAEHHRTARRAAG